MYRSYQLGMSRSNRVVMQTAMNASGETLTQACSWVAGTSEPGHDEPIMGRMGGMDGFRGKPPANSLLQGIPERICKKVCLVHAGSFRRRSRKRFTRSRGDAENRRFETQRARRAPGKIARQACPAFVLFVVKNNPPGNASQVKVNPGSPRRGRRLAVLQHFDFFERDETAAHHLVEHGKKRVDLFLRVHDFDDDRQVF